MTLKTLENALEVLSCFTKENSTWGVRDLSKEMDMHHAVVHRILSTFEKKGFLKQNLDTKKYELGMKLLEYGMILRDQLRISDMVYPVMKKMEEEIGESIFLTLLDKNEGVCVEVAESQQRIKYAVSVGSRSSLYAGSNKVIMAYLPRENQLEIINNGLQPFTSLTIHDKEELLEDLAKIKEQGMCYTVGEYSEDVFGLSVPIFNHSRQIIGALAAAGPAYRMSESQAVKALKTLKWGKAEIQQYISSLQPSVFNLS